MYAWTLLSPPYGLTGASGSFCVHAVVPLAMTMPLSTTTPVSLMCLTMLSSKSFPLSCIVLHSPFAFFFCSPCIIVHFSDCLILLLSDCSSLSLAVVVFSFQIEVYSEGLNYKVHGEASINEKLAAASWRLVPTYDYLPSVRPN